MSKRANPSPPPEPMTLIPDWWLDGAWRIYVRAGLRMEITEDINDAPDRPGVYFLWGGPTGRLLYVGVASDLRRRLWQHRDQRRIPFRSACWIETPLMLREYVEHAYITALRPPYNVKMHGQAWKGTRRMARLIERVWRQFEADPC